MEYGLMSLALQFPLRGYRHLPSSSDAVVTSAVAMETGLRVDMNANARNLAKPLSSRGIGRALTERVPSEKSSSTMAIGIRSSGSLARTPSLETPLGIVRQTSANNMEAVHVPSVTSQRDIGTYTLKSMPALAEDDHNSDDEGPRYHSKTRDKSKIKRSRRISESEFSDIDMESLGDRQTEEVELGPEHDKPENDKRISRIDKLINFFGRIFPCTKPKRSEPKLLDISSCPHE